MKQTAEALNETHIHSLTAGGSSCPQGQGVSLSLLLCSRELLGQALDHIAEEAGLGHRGIKEPNIVCVPHINQIQTVLALLDQHSGHRTAQRPRSDLHRS